MGMCTQPTNRREYVLAQVHRSANAHARTRKIDRFVYGRKPLLEHWTGRIYEYKFDWNIHVVATSYVCQHDVLGALHFILAFLRPSSRAPAVERIVSATCVLQSRRVSYEQVSPSIAWGCLNRCTRGSHGCHEDMLFIWHSWVRDMRVASAWRVARRRSFAT